MRRMRRTEPGLLILAVSVALLGVTFCSWQRSDEAPEARPTAAPLSAEAPDPLEREAHPPRLAPEHSAGTRTDVSVVDAETGAAVPAPWFAQPSAGGRAIATADALEGSDAGTIELAALSASRSWVVGADGYVPALFTDLTAGGVLRLPPGQRLTVRLSGEFQEPVEGATVLLAPQDGVLPFPENTPRGPLVGQPGSDAPLWVRRSRADGTAEFDGLPEGEYRVEVRDEASFLVARGGMVDASAPGDLSLVMEQAYAVVVRAPPDHSWMSWSWQARGELRRDASLYRAKAWIHAALQRRFPDALIYVGRPADTIAEPARRMTCNALLEGALLQGPAAGSVTWPLEPIGPDLAPVDLQLQSDVSLRSAIVWIVGPSGARLDLEIKLVSSQLRDDGGRDIYYGETGQPIVVPTGRYDVVTRFVPTWVEDALDGTAIELLESSPHLTEHTLRLKHDLRLLEMRFLWPEGVDGYLHFSLDLLEQKDSMSFMNRRPFSGPLSCLVPTGRVRLHAQTAPYLASFDETVDVVPGESTLVHTIDLTPR